MKSLVVADIHLNDNNLLFFNKILFPCLRKITRTYDFNKVIFLGDIFDNVNNVNKVTLNLFFDLMNIFKKYNKDIIVGNHDLLTKNSSIFDLFFLDDTFNVYNVIQTNDNYIYLPYIQNKENLISGLNQISKYITDSDYDVFYIFSHNDFSEIYKFNNNFVDLIDNLNVNKLVYFINGHNHVPFFKQKDNIYICNIGCSVNLDYKDGCHHNFYCLIDDNVEFLVNKNNIKFYTFDIVGNSINDDILDKLNTSYIKYVTFRVFNANFKLDYELEKQLKEKFNVQEVKIEYTFNIKECDFSDFLIDKNSSTEDGISDSIKNLIDDIGLKYDDFYEVDRNKIDVLMYLLNEFIKDNNISEEEREQLLHVINKHYIKDINIKKKDEEIITNI